MSDERMRFCDRCGDPIGFILCDDCTKDVLGTPLSMLELAPLKNDDEPLCGVLDPEGDGSVFCQKAFGHDFWHTAAVRPLRDDGTEPFSDEVSLTMYSTWPPTAPTEKEG